MSVLPAVSVHGRLREPDGGQVGGSILGFMTHHKTQTGAHWQQLAELATSSLQPLLPANDCGQWFVVHHNGVESRCVMTHGQGPFSNDMSLPWPLDTRLQTVTCAAAGSGSLMTAPIELADEGTSLLGRWLPEETNSAEAGELRLLNVKATLLGQLLGQIRRNETLMRELELAHRDASMDSLTGLLNRRGWNQQLEREDARCGRYGGECSVVVIDLNDLKRINDRDGHCAGDGLLQDTARAIAETLRKPDMAARLGGDEFAVLLVAADARAAEGFCARLRQRFLEERISAAIGAATRKVSEPLQETTCRADNLMYQEKNRARQSGKD